MTEKRHRIDKLVCLHIAVSRKLIPQLMEDLALAYYYLNIFHLFFSLHPDHSFRSPSCLCTRTFIECCKCQSMQTSRVGNMLCTLRAINIFTEVRRKSAFPKPL